MGRPFPCGAAGCVPGQLPPDTCGNGAGNAPGGRLNPNDPPRKLRAVLRLLPPPPLTATAVERPPVYVISAGRAQLLGTGAGTVALLLRHSVPCITVLQRREAEDYRHYPCQRVWVETPGVAAARNAAVRHARSTGARSLWIWDDDVSELGVSPVELLDKLVRPERFAGFPGLAVIGLEYEALARFKQPDLVTVNSYACVVVHLDVAWATAFPYRGAVAEDYDLVLRVVLAGGTALRCRGLWFRAAPRATLPGGCAPMYADATALQRAYAEFVERWAGVAVPWRRGGRPDVRVVPWGAGLREALLAMPAASREAALAPEARVPPASASFGARVAAPQLEAASPVGDVARCPGQIGQAGAQAPTHAQHDCSEVAPRPRDSRAGEAQGRGASAWKAQANPARHAEATPKPAQTAASGEATPAQTVTLTARCAPPPTQRLADPSPGGGRASPAAPASQTDGGLDAGRGQPPLPPAILPFVPVKPREVAWPPGVQDAWGAVARWAAEAPGFPTSRRAQAGFGHTFTWPKTDVGRAFVDTMPADVRSAWDQVTRGISPTGVAPEHLVYQLNRNYQAAPHRDLPYNIGASVLILYGDFTGGELVIGGRDYLPRRLLVFDGRVMHFVRPFRGLRMALIAYISGITAPLHFVWPLGTRDPGEAGRALMGPLAPAKVIRSVWPQLANASSEAGLEDQLGWAAHKVRDALLSASSRDALRYPLKPIPATTVSLKYIKEQHARGYGLEALLPEFWDQLTVRWVGGGAPAA